LNLAILKKALTSAAAVLVVSAAASAPAAANLLTNGSFETADLTGWQLTNLGGSYVDVQQAFGTCFGGFPNQCFYQKNDVQSLTPVALSQTFSTSAGTVLDIVAYFQIENADPASGFSILFDGQVVYSSFGQVTPWQQASATVISTGSDTLSFSFSGLSPMLFDEASVTAAVPEPVSLALVGVALLGLPLVSRRKKRAQPPLAR